MIQAQSEYLASGNIARDVIIGRDPDILADIRDPGIAAAIWQRTPEPGFQRWIDAQPKSCLPELRAVIPVHFAEAAVTVACDNHGMAASAERERLASDVGALALMLAKVLKVRQVRLRLDVSDEVMCPKFHLDNVRARLLCTYRGPGTEYGPECGSQEISRIRQVPQGAVALFRGRLWSSEEATGLLHRSPASAPGAGARLLLVIDPVD